jgi:predicted flap endonuclease-1-like 5' DNA nuclease
MQQMIEANWPYIGLAVVVVLLLVMLLARRGPARERHRAPDALDEGVAPAQRNQAFIDAPSAVKAAELADTGPDIMAGMGEALAFGAAVEATLASHQAEAPAAPQADTGTSELARIKGLGPKLQTLLPTLGVSSLSQIAAWTDVDIDRIDAQLGTFAGRIRRDNWVDQAKFLAAGDTAGFENKFGKL